MDQRDGMIIDRPELVSRARKGLWGTVTLVAWLLYAWLLIPLISLALWALGAFTAFDVVISALPTVDFGLLIFIGVMAFTFATALMLWVEINRRRFEGLERRERASDVPLGQIAGQYGVPPQVMYALQTGRNVTVQISADGWPQAALSEDPAS